MPADSQHRYINPWLIAVSVMLGTFMEVLDTTVVNVALPHIAGSVSATVDETTWVLTSYLVSNAIILPMTGWLANFFGRKRILLMSVAGFTLSSLACGLAPSLPVLIFFRVVQGATGGGLQPLSQAIMLEAFPPEKRGKAMAFWALGIVVAPMLGPVLGGWITETYSWRWIFYINLPIGVLGYWLVKRFIATIPPAAKPPRFDLGGFVLCGVGLGGLLFGLELIGQSADLPVALGLLLVGVCASLTYLWHARRRRDPLLDLSLLRIDSFRLSVIGGSLMRVTQGAQPFLLPLMFQIGFGFSAVRSGQLILATALGALLTRSFTPRLLQLVGFRKGMLYNGVLSSLGYAVCAFFRPSWPFGLMFGLLMACGAFMSFQFAAYNTVAYEGVPRERLGASNSLYSTLQQLMLSFGICAGALLLRLAMGLGGHAQPRVMDFSFAFIVVTLVSLSSTVWHLRFAHDAGHELSGHRPRPLSPRP